MAHLALEGVHRLQADGLAGGEHLGDGLLGDLGQLGSTIRAVAVDVQHEPRTVACARLDRQTGQLLNRLEDLPVASDEVVELALVTLLGGEHGNRGAPVVNVDVNVAAQVGDVEKLLEVVGTDLALLLEARDGVAHRLTCGLAGGVVAVLLTHHVIRICHGNRVVSPLNTFQRLRFFLA